jgi:hypothetical protein
MQKYQCLTFGKYRGGGLMKKGLFVFVFIMTLVFSACSTPGSALAYPEPILAKESSVFIGTGLKYASARESAIERAAAGGYTRIVAEIIEQEGVLGMIQVTLVMIR